MVSNVGIERDRSSELLEATRDALEHVHLDLSPTTSQFDTSCAHSVVIRSCEQQQRW